MPTLPTLTITDQAVWDRLYAAFNGDAVAYKTWLKEHLIEKVRLYEAYKASEKAETDLAPAINQA